MGWDTTVGTTIAFGHLECQYGTLFGRIGPGTGRLADSEPAKQHAPSGMNSRRPHPPIGSPPIGALYVSSMPIHRSAARRSEHSMRARCRVEEFASQPNSCKVDVQENLPTHFEPREVSNFFSFWSYRQHNRSAIPATACRWRLGICIQAFVQDLWKVKSLGLSPRCVLDPFNLHVFNSCHFQL